MPIHWSSVGKHLPGVPLYALEKNVVKMMLDISTSVSECEQEIFKRV